MNKDELYEFDALPTVDSVQALFALATAMEREGARRYDELAAHMGASGNAATALVFANLADQERQHENGVLELAHRHAVDVAMDELPGIRWQLPESLSEDAIADAGGDALMTAADALDLAVHNEERAFALYVRIASEADDPSVREYAERIANEELGHVAQLRLERRRARRQTAPRPGPSPDSASLHAYFDEGEAALRSELGAAIAACRDEGFDGAATRLETLFGSEIPGADGAPARPGTALSLVDGALRTTEALYAGVMSTTEQTTDEALLCEAQILAEEIVRWFATLGDVRAELGGAIQTPHDLPVYDDS